MRSGRLIPAVLLALTQAACGDSSSSAWAPDAGSAPDSAVQDTGGADQATKPDAADATDSDAGNDVSPDAAPDTALPDSDASDGAAPSCGISASGQEQLHTLLDQVTAAYTNSVSFAGNYPQVIYDVQEITANALVAADWCGDAYMLDALAKLYFIPFSYLGTDVDNNAVWLDGNTHDREVVLYSTQFLYAVARLVNTLVRTDKAAWTPAMQALMDLPRQHLIAHLERWLTKKSMWIWTECGGAAADPRVSYTFPEYVSLKTAHGLGVASSAPPYCNAMTEVELWVAAAGTELLDADSISHESIGLSAQLAVDITSFAHATTVLFESRVSTLKSTSPMCGGACDALGFDVGGWHGHPEYPAADWPSGHESWDISHARRLVQFIESVYGHPGISQPPTMTEQTITVLASNAIVYLAFNGSYADPAFSNFLDGTNVPYRTYAPFELSSSYYRAGYGFWGRFNADVAKINDALVPVVAGNVSTTYMTPSAPYDLLGFYASLARPPTP